MNSGFLFWLFLIGIITATLQDLKRREVDNWLNLSLIFISIAFFSFTAITLNTPTEFFHLLFMLGFMFIVANACYHGHVFAGGDAKLLFAMTVFFIGTHIYESLTNVGVFLLLLMVCGSIYGLSYSLYLYKRDIKKINAHIRKEGLQHVRASLWAGILFLAGGLLSPYLFIFAALFFILPLLYSFARGVEAISMIRIVKGSELREGDWLVEDVKIGKKIIAADWDGLSKEDIAQMKKLKHVQIREGIPFVPAFLLAFTAYHLFKDLLIGIF